MISHTRIEKINAEYMDRVKHRTKHLPGNEQTDKQKFPNFAQEHKNASFLYGYCVVCANENLNGHDNSCLRGYIFWANQENALQKPDILIISFLSTLDSE